MTSIQIDQNPSDRFMKETLRVSSQYSIKPLAAVITAPIIRMDGTILDIPGYDEATRLFLSLDLESDVQVPFSPSIDEARAALDYLVAPFSQFPYVDADARGAMLAALLTAVNRPVLPTAPAFGFDAAMQGSGKSLLADAAGALAVREELSFLPPTAGRDDEEMRKRLLALLASGARVIVIDNVVGELDSPSLASALTASTFQDRELGRSKMITVSNRAMMIFTGNNLQPSGDMVRRVIRCRIDPQMENPFTRTFDFDPAAFVRENRLSLVVAALTLMRARWTHAGPPTPGRLGSFEEWDQMIGQTVAWVAKHLTPGQFGDPVNLVLRTQDNDPVAELEAMFFEALLSEFGDSDFEASDIFSKRIGVHEVYETLVELAGENAVKSAKSIGKALSYRQDRVRNGLQLKGSKSSKKAVKTYRIIRISA